MSSFLIKTKNKSTLHLNLKLVNTFSKPLINWELATNNMHSCKYLVSSLTSLNTLIREGEDRVGTYNQYAQLQIFSYAYTSFILNA